MTMPAVKEAPKMNETAGDSVAQWKMPPIHVGESVLWYVDGAKNSTPPVSARVVHVSARSVELVLMDRDRTRYARDVHYIADPRIRENDEIKRYGGWEYSDMHFRMADMERRITELEDKATK
jgi:hypothetical protein